MASSNNDYLKFSAYSIKDLITRKLSDNTKFTDQIYEGSNLAILIDIVSYMYQCLLYNLNNAAAESMWSDTQIYENINRLCKFIGYNPKGYSTATCIFTLTNNANQKFSNISIPRYSYIDTNKVDSRGRKIFYSTRNQQFVSTNKQNEVLFYNGRWKLYSTVFTSNGESYQTFTLDGLKSDSSDTVPMYVPSDMIDVYVSYYENDTRHIDRWNAVNEGIFTDNRVENGTQIYTQNDTIYNVRLNENKTYELTFGNDFNGKIPPQNALIYVFYLDSNGADGVLNLGEVNNAKLQHNASAFGIDAELYDDIFRHEMSIKQDVNDILDYEKTTQYLLDNGKWQNNHNSSDTAEEETVEEIRHNAPQWFKLGNRLITTDDWEYYIKNIFRKNNVIDVKCQNNWGYISTFYRWLYNIGVEKKQNGKYYLTQSRISKDAKYSDAADSNNVYLWIKMKDDADIYTTIFDNNVQNIKAITQEPVYLKPLDVMFCICAETAEYACKNYFDESASNKYKYFDENAKSYLEITVDDNVLYSPINIQNQVHRIIIDFFKPQNFSLGQLINYNDLTQKILNIKGINRIRTVYFDPAGKYEQQRILDGISFATWTNGFIDLGDDLQISNTSRSLEVFQFPKLYREEQLQSKIKIIKKSLNTVNTIQY